MPKNNAELETELDRPIPFGNQRHHDTDLAIRSLILQAISNHKEKSLIMRALNTQGIDSTTGKLTEQPVEYQEDLIIDVLTAEQVAYYDVELEANPLKITSRSAEPMVLTHTITEKQVEYFQATLAKPTIGNPKVRRVLTDIEQAAEANWRAIAKWLLMHGMDEAVHEVNTRGLDKRFSTQSKPDRNIIRIPPKNIPTLVAALKSPCKLKTLKEYYVENPGEFNKAILPHFIESIRNYSGSGNLYIEALTNEQVEAARIILNSIPRLPPLLSISDEERTNLNKHYEEVNYIQHVANENLLMLSSWLEYYGLTGVSSWIRRAVERDKRFGILGPSRYSIEVPPVEIPALVELIKSQGGSLPDFQLPLQRHSAETEQALPLAEDPLQEAADTKAEAMKAAQLSNELEQVAIAAELNCIQKWKAYAALFPETEPQQEVIAASNEQPSQGADPEQLAKELQQRALEAERLRDEKRDAYTALLAQTQPQQTVERTEPPSSLPEIESPFLSTNEETPSSPTMEEPPATAENPSANLTLNILGWFALSVGILALATGLLFTFGVFPAVLAAIGTTAAIGMSAGGGMLAVAGGAMLGTRFFESSCRLGLGPTTHSAMGTIP